MKKRIKMREQFRFPNNNLFIFALISLILFLSVELFLRIYNLYITVPWVDIPSHFTAGIAIASIIFWILSTAQIHKKKVFTVLFTFVAAAIWELLETLEEMVIENPPWMKDIFFWDGFWDIIVAIIGSLVALSVIKHLKINGLIKVKW
jgi:hypothetical protein